LAAQFFSHPDVILVAQRNQVAGAKADGILKVFGGTQVLRIADESHEKWCGTRELFDNFSRGIRCAVVADNHLIGQARLRGNAG